MMSFDGDLLTVGDFERYCRELVPPATYRFLYGDIGDPNWTTHTRNRRAFEALKLRPRVLIDVGRRNLSTTVLGYDIDVPVIIGPVGTGDFLYLDDTVTARAAGASGTIMVLSGQSSCSADDVSAAAAGPWFQQVWLLTDRGLTEWMVRRAAEVGAAAIVLTVSNNGATWHGQHLRFARRWLHIVDEMDADAVGPPAANLARYQGDPVPSYVEMTDLIDRRATWVDVEWLKSLTDLPLILKGIQTAEDAEVCMAHGVDAIVVSNHGGRFLQGARNDRRFTRSRRRRRREDRDLRRWWSPRGPRHTQSIGAWREGGLDWPGRTLGPDGGWGRWHKAGP